MKCSIISAVLILFLFSNMADLVLTQAQPANIQCGKYICFGSQGTCFYNTTCICNAASDTFPEDSAVMCNYSRKSQIIAFLLETVVSFGAGHFYILNLSMAIPKLLCWIIGYSFFISIRLISSKREENDSTALLLSLGGCLTCFVMVSWYIADVIMFAFNKYGDGNGIYLQSW